VLVCYNMKTKTGGARAEDGPEGPRLTPLRRKIIGVIEDSVASRGYPPSLREIGQAVGLASTSSVSYQMSVLKGMGYVSREAGRPRTAVLQLPRKSDTGPRTLAREDPRAAEVPLVGRIAAGMPIIADELAELADEIISVPRMLTGRGSMIALRVAGDSMIGASISDGDLVVVRLQPDAESGDIVAALLPADGSADWEATVKTLKKAGGHVWLLPHNPAYDPILADSAVVVGKVVSVLRRV
jgi:repressor LexA